MVAYRITLADDHVLIRQGLKRIIDGVADLLVMGEAGDGEELLALLRENELDMVILDISMPGSRGVDVLQNAKKLRPNVKILVLTMHKEYLHQALAAGADGYLVKEDADRELFSAIEGIRQGKTYVSPRLREDAVESPATLLTAREREILKLVAEGKSSKQIAEILFISARTVESHRSSILGKLHLKSAADLIKYAIQNGYA